MLHYDYEPLSVPDVRVGEVVYSGFLRAARAMRVKWKKKTKKQSALKTVKTSIELWTLCSLVSATSTLQIILFYRFL